MNKKSLVAYAFKDWKSDFKHINSGWQDHYVETPYLLGRERDACIKVRITIEEVK